MFRSTLSFLVASAVLLAGCCFGQVADPSWGELMKAGDAARKAREYEKADKLYQAGLKAAQKMGPSDPHIATTLVTLASMYEEVGNLRQVEILHKLAIAVDEKGQGKDHPAVALRLCGLAQYYQNRARFADAEPLLARAVSIDEKAPGAKKADLARALTQYAAVLRKLDRNAEAEKVEARAKAIR